MDKKVLFHAFMEVLDNDLNKLQDFAQDALDRVVRDLLYNENAFVGLTVTKSSPTAVSVSTGTYISNGKRYPKDAATSHSITNLVPATLSRACIVVAYGQEAQTDTEPRKKLIDATTRQTQTVAVATRVVRAAVIDVLAGSPSANPARPPVPSGAIVIASFLINASGIVGNPVMEEANRSISLEAAYVLLAQLAATDKKYAAQIEALSTQIAALQKDINTRATNTHVNHILSDLLELRERLGVPDDSSFYGMDLFANEDESDTAFAGYTAKVEAGAMQHGDVETSSTLTALLNPTDPKVVIAADGMVIPSYFSVVKIQTGDVDEFVSIAQYAVSTVVGKKLTMTKVWRYFGGKSGDAAVAETIKKNPKIAVIDPVSGAKSTIDLTGSAYTLKRLTGKDSQYFELKVSTPYWDVETETVETTGSRIAQTFLLGSEGWYPRIDLWFTDVGPTGSVRLTVCECSNSGLPNLDKILSEATIAQADLKVGAWTEVDIPAVYLERAKRYAIVLTTTGNHFVGVSTSNGITQGSLVASTDGTTWSAEIAKDLCMRMIAAKYKESRAVVPLGSVSLPGGMTSLQAAFTGFIPEGADLLLEGQIGGVWRPIGEEDPSVFASLPTLVPLRLIWSGTYYAQAGVNLSKSRIVASRPRTSSVHVSTIRSLGAGTTTKVVVEQNSRDFVEANHDWTVHLLHGAGYTTVATATAVKTGAPSNGRTVRTWTFDGLPNISSYRIRTTLAATSATNQHSVQQRRDYAA